MMNLSTMKKVVATVDGEWRSSLAESILERWGYDEGSVYYFRASANFLFIFKRNEKTYFLRFSNSTDKDLSSLESEIKILEYLRTQPIRVALPVKSIQENYIETVDTDIGTFHAVVFEALQGKQFETEELQEEQFFKWGCALGELHTILKSLPDELRLQRKSWNDQLSLVKELLPDDETAALKELDQLMEWSQGLRISNENFGLIHYDFELDNQRWDHETIGILDFDDCINHWYVADIAFALRDIFKEEVNLNLPPVQEFLNGYRSQTELDSILIRDLPLFMRLHNLTTFAGLLKTVDIPESQDHPEWLSNLREKLLNYIEQYRSSFGKHTTSNHR
jgi:Ser/Thr protein kinase RdoA (MazF antagonist)